MFVLFLNHVLVNTSFVLLASSLTPLGMHARTIHIDLYCIWMVIKVKKFKSTQIAYHIFIEGSNRFTRELGHNEPKLASHLHIQDNKNYSLIKLFRHTVPAVINSLSSPLIWDTNVMDDRYFSILLNTRALCCFHRLQAVRVTIQSKPLVHLLGINLLDLNYHSSRQSAINGGAMRMWSWAKSRCQVSGL